MAFRPGNGPRPRTLSRLKTNLDWLPMKKLATHMAALVSSAFKDPRLGIREKLLFGHEPIAHP